MKKLIMEYKPKHIWKIGDTVEVIEDESGANGVVVNTSVNDQEETRHEI